MSGLLFFGANVWVLGGVVGDVGWGQRRGNGMGPRRVGGGGGGGPVR